MRKRLMSLAVIGLLSGGPLFAKSPLPLVLKFRFAFVNWMLKRARVLSMSVSPSLRGCGDALTRRLSDLRADILARGLPTWHIHAAGFPSVSTRTAVNIPRWFQIFRSRGVSVVHVYETRSLGPYRVWVDKGADWLLLSNPIVLTSLPRYERSESAERSNRKVAK